MRRSSFVPFTSLASLPSFASFLLPTGLVLALAAPAAGEGIDFEDVAPHNDPGAVLADEYAARGIAFGGPDGAVWQGMSEGDPGGFGIEGSNGPSFLGFDGPGFATEVRFAEPVRDVRFDLARGIGGTFHFFFVLHGYRDGELVDMDAVVLGDIGEWQELALAGEFDTVRWWSIGDFRYAVDDLRWEGTAPAVRPVAIDVMPGSEHNPMRIGRPGAVPVVLYGEPDLDVREVVVESLGLGPDLAATMHPGMAHLEDLDGDGLLDLLAHFRSEHTGLGEMDHELCLSGELGPDALYFEGCDDVTPVGGGRR